MYVQVSFQRIRFNVNRVIVILIVDNNKRERIVDSSRKLVRLLEYM